MTTNRFARPLSLALISIGMLQMFPAIAAEPAQPLDLRVVIKTSTNAIRIREPFNMELRVENPAATNQTIRVMNCSWQEEWQSSNPKISLGGVVCTKNFAVNVVIPPGGAYMNRSDMMIYDLIPDKKLSFRMGFTSIGSKQIFWSNEVKLRILPPDFWRQGAMLYRDRNHDGKIDWEASGKTWVTGGIDVYKVDTNYDGFYDLEYGAGGATGRIQWSTNIHERVPRIGKDFVPVQKEAWIDLWKE